MLVPTEISIEEFGELQREDPVISPLLDFLDRDVTPTRDDLRALPLESRNLRSQRPTIRLQDGTHATSYDRWRCRHSGSIRSQDACDVEKSVNIVEWTESIYRNVAVHSVQAQRLPCVHTSLVPREPIFT